jgi:hypothetical protein
MHACAATRKQVSVKGPFPHQQRAKKRISIFYLVHLNIYIYIAFLSFSSYLGSIVFVVKSDFLSQSTSRKF